MQKKKEKKEINQNRPPNFVSNGRLFLVRCFACGGKQGTENWAPAVASGSCAWCGWGYKETKGE